jgi:transglutaminase-like putative cysteine protease
MESPKSNRALGIAYQIPRNSLVLLMVAQVVVVTPFALQLSPWIVGVGLFCGCWRMGVYQGRWDYPQRWVKALLVGASFLGVAFSGVGVFSLEAAASVLILAFALKLIEMKSRRDAYVVIFLGYFAIATQFLFDQSITLAIYEFAAICVVTAAMVGLNQLHTRVRPWVSLRLAATLVFQALPFTVVLFLFFPRIAPLWTVPLPNAATTGISERVTPGDVARLTQSDELAFRVQFDGDVPALRDLYWRGLVYPRFSQGTWSVGGRLGSSEPAPTSTDENVSWRYEILLEPTLRDWLFALDSAVPVTANVQRTGDFHLRAIDPVLSVFRYEVTSYPRAQMNAVLPERIRQRDLRLDPTDNPRIVAQAKDLFARSGSDSARFVNRVLQMIREQPYAYTLSPPELDSQASIDQFWFDTRAGFCTHYAGAFVTMARAAGIPARMVGGYQGGEINPITGHLVVRQYDAHAWAEYWAAGAGWTRVDPTAAVAPERIESGLNAALSAEDRATLSLFTSARFGASNLLGDVLNWADSLEHRWNLSVVGYDTHFQADVLKKYLGEITPLRVGGVMLIGGGISVGFVAFTLFWRRRPLNRHPVERLFRNFDQRLAGYGLHREPAESPGAFVARVAGDAGLRGDQYHALVAELNGLLYNPGQELGPARLRQLRGGLRRLRYKLAFNAAR